METRRKLVYRARSPRKTRESGDQLLKSVGLQRVLLLTEVSIKQVFHSFHSDAVQQRDDQDHS